MHSWSVVSIIFCNVQLGWKTGKSILSEYVLTNCHTLKLMDAHLGPEKKFCINERAIILQSIIMKLYCMMECSLSAILGGLNMGCIQRLKKTV